MTAPRETAAKKTRWPATRMTGTRALAAIVGPGATDDSQEEIPDMILASSNGRPGSPIGNRSGAFYTASGAARGRTTLISVAAKSSPVHRTGYPVRSASA